MIRKRLVISATALRSGGTLSILHDCLRELDNPIYDCWEIIALVIDPDRCRKINRRVKYVGVNTAGNYLKRIYYEYFYFRLLSKRIKADLWLSLHDLTPRVSSNHIVYCHNPSPFYRLSLQEALIEPSLALFNLFYGYFYGINIRRNKYIVVQQAWLRDMFCKRYNVSSNRVIVARPEVAFIIPGNQSISTNKKKFFFPTFPRVFKNIEVIAKAVAQLSKEGFDFEVIVTIDGSENKYADKIVKEYRVYDQLRFIGEQKRERVFELYAEVDFLIFPSKLETWGMPLSEFKVTGKAMIVADLPYAHETVGDYDSVLFFNPNDASELAEKMKNLIFDTASFTPHRLPVIGPPMASNWAELFKIISIRS